MTDAPAAWQSELAPRYRLGRKLGAGATSGVWAATRVSDQRPVAIKVLRRELAIEVGTERFLREIAVVGALSHTGIIPILDSGEVDGLPFHVMPLVDGETLRARLSRELQLPLDATLRIARQVAAAIDAAHAAGVVHRDIKPENILLAGDRAYVSDFGVAFAIDAAAGDRLTASGLTVGTPQYMSPEQSSAERHLDGRSDIYSLACVCFEMLAGQPPFTGATTQAIRARHVTEAPPSLLVVRPSLPAAVNDAIQKGLAKSPADRPPTATALVDAMSAELTAAVLPANAVMRRVALGAVAVAVVAGAAWLVARSRSEAAAPAWVLVGDFASADSDRAGGAAIRELVTAQLSQSRRFSVVASDQVATARRNAGIADSVPLDYTLAAQLAVRSAARVFVTGTFGRLGRSTYSITLYAVNAETKEKIFTGSAPAADSGEGLVHTVDNLAKQMREKLGESAQDIAATRPLRNVRTPSFEAFVRYSDALAAVREGRYDAGARLAEIAVGLDTGFAAAWAVRAHAFVGVRQLDSAAAAFAKADAHIDRLTAAEADRMHADEAFSLAHDMARAASLYTKYLEQEPTSIGGHNNLALCFSAVGRYTEAAAEFGLAMRIDPLAVGPRQVELLNLSAEMVTIGRIDSARVLATRLAGSSAQYMQLLLLNAAGKWDSLAVRAAQIADDAKSERFMRIPARTSAAAARIAIGDTADGVARFARAEADAKGGELRWFLGAHLLSDAARGVRTAWPLPASFASDTSPGATLVRGLHGVGSGDTALAARSLRRLAALDSSALKSIGFGRLYLEARLAMARGDFTHAADLLDEPARSGEHDPFTLDRVSSVALRWASARALAAAGRSTDATRMLALLTRATEMPPQHYPLRALVVPFAGSLPLAGSPRGAQTAPQAPRKQH